MIKLTRRRDKKYLKIDYLLPILIFISGLMMFLVSRSLFANSPDVLSFSTIGVSVFEKFLNKKVNKDAEFEKLKNSFAEQGNKFGFYIEDISTGKTYAYNENVKIYAASMYKFPVAVTVLNEIQKKNMALTTELTYTQADFEGGTGSINRNSFGTIFSIEQLLTNLIDYSDNVAQNILLHRISKPQVGALINQNLDSTSGSLFAAENVTSPAEMGNFLKNIYKGEQLTQENKNLLFIFIQTFFNELIT